MARTNNLTNFLTDVAGAIKEKKGSEANIPAANFDTEIRNLPSQGTYEEKTINVTQNGTQTVTPSQGYDAIDELTINANVQPSLQSKSYSFTQNTTTTIIPEQGYDGFSSIGLEINVPSGSGDVKLFDTVAHMQADSNPSEGDLAVVYREELTGIDENSEFSSCTFPNTVVLSSAYTDSIYCRFRATDGGWFDGNVDMSSSSFRFNAYGESNVRVQYTSSDGITYTRTDGGEELVDFGTTIKFENLGDPFPSVLSNFMLSRGNYFEGLYEYKNSNWSACQNQLTVRHAYELLPGISAYGQQIITGDGTIYSHLNKANICENILGLEEYATLNSLSVYSKPNRYIASDIIPAKVYQLKESNVSKDVYMGEITDLISPANTSGLSSNYITHNTDKTVIALKGGVYDISSTPIKVLQYDNPYESFGYYPNNAVGYKNKLIYFSYTDRAIHHINLDTLTDTSISSSYPNTVLVQNAGIKISDNEYLYTLCQYDNSIYSVKLLHIDIDAAVVTELKTITVSTNREFKTNTVMTDLGNIYMIFSITSKMWIYKYNSNKTLTTVIENMTATGLVNNSFHLHASAIEKNNKLYFTHPWMTSMGCLDYTTATFSTFTVTDSTIDLYCSFLDKNMYFVKSDGDNHILDIYEYDDMTIDGTAGEITGTRLCKIPGIIAKKGNSAVCSIYPIYSYESSGSNFYALEFGYINGVFTARFRNRYGRYYEVSNMDKSYEIVSENADISIINTCVNAQDASVGFVYSNILILGTNTSPSVSL